MKKIGLMCCFALLLLLSSKICFADEFDFKAKLENVIEIDQNIDFDIRGNIELNLQKYDFIVMIGKDQLIWGVGKTDTFVLSSTAPSIPYLKYQFELPFFKYTRFMSPLERDKNRWLFGHRLDSQLTDFLHVGINEFMLCNHDVFPAYYFPIPYIPLYAIQKIGYTFFGNKYDYNSNALFSMDFIATITSKSNMYGELVVDDFPARVENKNPRKIGGLLGVQHELSGQFDIWGEYVRINNYVYTHKNSANRYLYLDKPFGHWLGMDGDLWAIGLDQEIREDIRLYWQVHKIRKGEGEYTDNWQINYGRDYEFLTGIVEHSYQFHVIAEYDYKENLQFKVGVTIGQSQNADHIENLVKNYVKLNVGLIGIVNMI